VSDTAPHSPTPSSDAPYASNPYASAPTAANLRAPEGTAPYTPWIWLIVAIPVLQAIPIVFIDWQAFINASLLDPTGVEAFTLFFSPAYIAITLFSFVGTGLTILFAYLDWRELRRRGVPQPFHWAWIFLIFAVGHFVYTIGRSIVVNRRIGRGLAPIWVTIATFVGGMVASIWLTVVLSQQFFDALLLTSFGP
jgi:hypothetical protein